MTNDELSDLLIRLARQIEPEIPEGFRFAIFVYQPRDGGAVSQISRDREETLLAVEKWIVARRQAAAPRGNA